MIVVLTPLHSRYDALMLTMTQMLFTDSTMAILIAAARHDATLAVVLLLHVLITSVMFMNIVAGTNTNTMLNQSMFYIGIAEMRGL